MKAYLITEEDIEKLQEIFRLSEDSWWFNARMDEWVEKLPILGEVKNLEDE